MKDYLNKLQENINDHIDELINNIKAFMKENNVSKFYIGMSGGLDCAVVSALAKKAGAEVIAITIPYQAKNSKTRTTAIQHAYKHCKQWDIPLYEVPLDAMNNALLNEVGSAKLNGKPLVSSDHQLARANILPRIRMTILYYVAQSNGGLVLGTGNLSELVMGYFTKWGDGAYDFNPVEKVTKTEMFMIAKALHICDEIVNKDPSADLWDGQTDEAEMGLTYEQIDEFILTGEGDEKTKVIVKRQIKNNRHKFRRVNLEATRNS